MARERERVLQTCAAGAYSDCGWEDGIVGLHNESVSAPSKASGSLGSLDSARYQHPKFICVSDDMITEGQRPLCDMSHTIDEGNW